MEESNENVPFSGVNLFQSLSPEYKEIVDRCLSEGDNSIDISLLDFEESAESEASVASTSSPSFNPTYKNSESDCNNYDFDILYKRFPDIIVKKQRRKKAQKSQQRIPPADGQIELVLRFANDTIPNRIQRICLYVERTEQNIPNSKELFFGQVELFGVRHYKDSASTSEYNVTANLDSVYEVDGIEVYKLNKTNKKEHNMFQVLVKVIFQNQVIRQGNTKPFLLAGRPDKIFPVPPLRKRPYKVLEVEDPFDDFVSPPPSYVEEIKPLVEADIGRFNDLYVAKLIKTGNADIAYHFKISDPNVHDNFEPGEIIGFFRDKLGKTVIEKLTEGNISLAYMKGVVTESQYLEANKPEDEKIKTVTICMLGLVDVKVYGQVNIGDHLYASKEHAGAAVSAHYHYREEQDKQAYIGQSLEATNFRKGTDRFNVKAIVSLVGAVANDLVKKEFSELEKSVESGTKAVSKKSRRWIIIASILTTIFVMLLLILFWQLFVPGSTFKRMRCLGGCTNKKHFARYWKWAEGKRYKGVEFQCDDLWEKISHRFYKHRHPRNNHHYNYQCPNKDYRYFLNIDTCSGVGMAPIIFAIDKNCTHVYTFNEIQGVWTLENQVCADKKCNMECYWRSYQYGTCDDKTYGTNCPLFSSSFDNYTTLSWSRSKDL